MIISIDGKKTLDKIKHTFIIKTLDKLYTERMWLNIIKTICNKPTVNIVLKGKI
jgi:hypothetical protein